MVNLWSEVEPGQGWYVLTTVSACTIEEYEAAARLARTQGEQEEEHIATYLQVLDTGEAEARWHEAEKALVGEGLLPMSSTQVQRFSVGPRFITDVCVTTEMLPAFRKALWEWGGLIESVKPLLERDGTPDPTAANYTISVQEINDLFHIGKLLVWTHLADEAEKKGGQGGH